MKIQMKNEMIAQISTNENNGVSLQQYNKKITDLREAELKLEHIIKLKMDIIDEKEKQLRSKDLQIIELNNKLNQT